MKEDEEPRTSEATIAAVDAAWERRKARLLRSLQETPLDKWLRRRR